MIRLIVGAVLASVAMFAFGGWFWIASPFPDEMISRPQDEDALLKTLKESLPESGTYYMPWGDRDTMSGKNEEALKKLEEKHEKGPICRVVIRQEGEKPRSPMFFAMGFGHYFVSALLMAVLLQLASPGLGGYLPRVLFVTLAGVFAAVAITLGDPIFLHQPWKTPLYFAAFYVVSWFVAGIVLGAIVRPSRG